MKIRVTRSPHASSFPSVPELGFGRYFADHMFLMAYAPEQGWHNPRIEPYRALGVEPGNLTLHYGQTIFEGLKAYRWDDGSIHLFRPEDHIERLARSAARLCMPDFDRGLMLDGLKHLVDVDRNWVPGQPGTSLYLRPVMMAADNALGVRPSSRYVLCVISSPVGSYYTKGAAPTRILVEERYSRAAAGGLGEAKTAANYAASLLAAEEAKAQGFDQVLWLDAKEHRYVEEVGTMNIFFVIDGVLITPPLGGTILDGITRRTVLELARQWGIPTEERRISMDEVADASRRGVLQEIFGSGTAAVISPVGELFHHGQSIVPTPGEETLRERFHTTITGIQYGNIDDIHGWTVHVPTATANGFHPEPDELVQESRLPGGAL